MGKYISRNGLRNILFGKQMAFERMGFHSESHVLEGIIKLINGLDNPLLTLDIVRCKDCIHAVELDKHCDLNRGLYKHCLLLRGDETPCVWHKYKKYYKNYSLVEAEDFCSYGERKE